jgi:hypothetical protein
MFVNSMKFVTTKLFFKLVLELCARKTQGRLVCHVSTEYSIHTLTACSLLQVYWAGENPKFPEGGKMTQHLAAMKVRGRAAPLPVHVQCTHSCRTHTHSSSSSAVQLTGQRKSGSTSSTLWQSKVGRALPEGGKMTQHLAAMKVRRGGANAMCSTVGGADAMQLAGRGKVQQEQQSMVRFHKSIIQCGKMTQHLAALKMGTQAEAAAVQLVRQQRSGSRSSSRASPDTRCCCRCRRVTRLM